MVGDLAHLHDFHLSYHVLVQKAVIAQCVHFHIYQLNKTQISSLFSFEDHPAYLGDFHLP